MVRPGFVLMAIIAAAVGVTSLGAFGGGYDLFTSSDMSGETERVAVYMDRA
jgi:hypothetical protein